jgi:hypothetical protein
MINIKYIVLKIFNIEISMLNIITPCSRQHNIEILYDSIDFDKITKWFIVYDTSNGRTYTKMYEGHPKIIETECSGGISGNPQRNFALDLVEDGFVYFLDDDNIIHPNFWSIADSLNEKYFYTFDQLRDKREQILKGDLIERWRIDTAMFIIHKNHIRETKWINDKYDADAFFIIEVSQKNPGCHIYKNITASYYNYI